MCGKHFLLCEWGAGTIAYEGTSSSIQHEKLTPYRFVANPSRDLDYTTLGSLKLISMSYQLKTQTFEWHIVFETYVGFFNVWWILVFHFTHIGEIIAMYGRTSHPSNIQSWSYRFVVNCSQMIWTKIIWILMLILELYQLKILIFSLHFFMVLMLDKWGALSYVISPSLQFTHSSQIKYRYIYIYILWLILKGGWKYRLLCKPFKLVYIVYNILCHLLFEVIICNNFLL